MNRKKFRLIGAVLLALALSMALLAGCGGSPSKGNGAVSGNNASQDGAAAQPEADADFLSVSSAEELLEAIEPGAKISVVPGYYNFSEYLTELWNTEGEDWNARHDYVQIQECYDGVEFVIRNVDGLSIRGGSDNTADTEIVLDPRYATIFNFENCSNLNLSRLTLGHTDLGSCSGNVINLRACKNIELRDMDLYGCGEVGLECTDATNGLSVYDSMIRDCSSGPLQIYDCTGELVFYDCSLTGSGGSGSYWPFGDSQLSFYRCTFGERESNGWYFNKNIYTEDCNWSEITEYPDYSDIEEEWDGEGDYEETPVITFNPETMAEADLDNAAKEVNFWVGYQKVDTQTGESVPLLEPTDEGTLSTVFMHLNEDGTGTLDGCFPEETSVPFLWEQDGALVTLWTLHHGSFYGTLYRPSEEDVYPHLWMSLQVENTLFWMY